VIKLLSFVRLVPKMLSLARKGGANANQIGPWFKELVCERASCGHECSSGRPEKFKHLFANIFLFVTENLHIR